MNGKLLALFATILVASSAATPTHNLRERKLLNPHPRPLKYVGPHAMDLAMCQGDCDRDGDCQVRRYKLNCSISFTFDWNSVHLTHAMLEKGWPRMLPEKGR